MRYKIAIEYDGTNYSGWQIQKGSPSIQEALESALFALAGEKTECYSAGRTDAGVHALAMPAHIELAGKWPLKNLLLGLNFHLRRAGHAISVLSVHRAAPDFHARFSCTRRHYIYKILCRPVPPAIDMNRVWWVKRELDHKSMDRIAQRLVGRHDFSTFRASGCQASSPVKTLDSIRISKRNGLIVVKTSARSFLHHQVRNMVGTLELVGAGKMTEREFMAAVNACDRTKGGPAAPAAGLYFEKADYRKEKT